MRTIAAGLLGLAFVTPSLTMAHHSRVTFFDMSRTVELAGEITRVQWRHPHVRYWIQADPEFGGALWELETTPPSLLERQGITRDILATGTHVRVAGPPSKVAEHAMEVSHVLLPDGREVLLHTGRAPRWTDNTLERALQGFADDAVRAAEASADGIYRVWTRPGLAGDDRPPFWLDSYPLTAQGQAAMAAWNAVSDIETGCTPKAMPALMGSFWPIEFVEAGDNLELRVEEFDSVRVIHMKTAPVPSVPSRLGYSTGRWEDGDLLVTTTGVDADQLDGRGIPMSRNAEFFERFSLNAEQTRLDYAITITDPTTFTDPITLTSHWVWRPGETIKPYDCIETPDSWTSKEIQLLE